MKYLRQVLDEPCHGNMLLSCGPQKLEPGQLLHEFNRDLMCTNYSSLSSGPPIRIAQTHLRGITIEQLSSLLAFVNKRVSTWCENHSGSPEYGQPLSFETFNFYHLHCWVIDPATAHPHACSYVELVATAAKRQRHLWFVSYVFVDPIHKFMGCLVHHASLRQLHGQLPCDATYWIASCANNLHRREFDFDGNPRKMPFSRALKLSGGLLLILDESCAVLTRIWNCFEVSLAMEERDKWRWGKPFLLDVAAVEYDDQAHLITDGLVPAEQRMERMMGLLAKGQREAGFPIRILDQAMQMDVASAHASAAKDKTKLLNSLRLPWAKTRMLLQDAPDSDPSYEAVSRAMREKMGAANLLSSMARDFRTEHYAGLNTDPQISAPLYGGLPRHEVSRIINNMERDLWNQLEDTVQKFFPKLAGAGWTQSDVEQKAKEIRAKNSYSAGVSMAYLLQDFVDLAQQKSQRVDPTFLQLKECFWLGEDKIGQDLFCPRDGKLGCALVDLLPPQDRKRQNYFMSWSWQYSLRQLTSALQIWQAQERREDIFFYMCFFVNNQFRLIVDGTPAGSDNLEEVFEENLQRCGRILAVLDTWDQPRYLRRVWTIYEQYFACSKRIPVTFVMPQEASASLSQQISLGDTGITEVIRSLSEVNVANAQAYDPRDERKVKDTIQKTVGFSVVNRHVKSAMVQWITGVVKEKFERLVQEAGDCEDTEDTEDTFFV